jgi:hypothetical protein
LHEQKPFIPQVTVAKIFVLTSFQGPANASPFETFPRFPDLPPELRVNIWKQALSDIDCGEIRVIVNFDLNHPRAIIPSPRQVKDLADRDEEDSDYNGEPDFTSEAAARHRSTIPAMLHVSRESRNILLSRYCLDLYSNIPDENTRLWNLEEDILYLPSFDYEYIMGKRLRTSLFSVQHLALPLARSLLARFKTELPMNPLYEWILNLPYLKTLSLLVEPFGKYDADGGRILLYEPFNVPITRLNRYTPSKIERLITETIKSCNPLGVSPSIEVFVMGF